jgi:hypothetical protein
MCGFLTYLQRDKRFASISHLLREIETLLRKLLQTGSIGSLLYHIVSKAKHYEMVMDTIEKKAETVSQYSPFHFIKK